MYGKRSFFRRRATKPKAKVVKRRYFGRKRYNRRSKAPLYKMPIAGIPSNRKLIKCRYFEQFNIVQGVTPISDTVLSLNSFWDPNQTSFTHSPMGWTQWNDKYKSYCVKYADVKVYANRISSTSGNVAVALMQSMESIPITSNTVRFMEEPRIYKKMLSSGAVGNKPTYLHKFYNMRKIFGVTDTDDNDDMTALMNANPLKQAWLHIMMMDISNYGSNAVNFSVQIDYYVELMEPLYLLQ